MEALFAADARYVDPMVAVEGHQAIAASIGAVHMQFPGFTFRLAGPTERSPRPSAVYLGARPGQRAGAHRRVRRRYS